MGLVAVSPKGLQLETGVRDYTVKLVRQSYRDFGPTLAAEALQEHHGITVGRETVRKCIVEAGLWLAQAAANVSSTSLPPRVIR